MGGLISGIAEATGAGSAHSPDARSLPLELQEILQQSGKLYKNEAEWSPKYADLTLSNLSRLLPGLTNQLNASNTSTRTSTAGDLSALAPGITSLYKSLNPGSTGLLDKLTTSASTGLDEGANIAPNDIFHITSGVRSDWANRGLGGSDPSMLDESVNLATAGEGLRTSRENTAAGVVGLNDASMAPAYGAIAGIEGTQGSGNGAAGGVVNRFAEAPNAFAQLGGYQAGAKAQNYSGELSTNEFNAKNEQHAWDNIGNGFDTAVSTGGSM